MKKYNKNISAIIIVTCLVCVVVSLFLPKNQTKSSKEPLQKASLLSFNKVPSKVKLKGEKIYVIRLEGVISDSSHNSAFLKDNTSSNAVIELIKKATKNKNVKAIVIRINSPGGTVAASQELYNAVIEAKKEKPVVVTMGDVAASGGYYIASASSAIFANPGTLTGSIGVITSYVNVHGLFQKLGLEGITIKSGKYKDIGNSTRPLTAEERKILQALLDDSYKQFLNDVSKGRNIPLSKVEKIAQGLIYTGKQAKEIGLVDHLGDYYKALEHAQKLAIKKFPELEKKYKDKELPVEESWRTSSVFDVLIGSVYKLNSKNSLVDERVLHNYSYSKFQPLWLLE